MTSSFRQNTREKPYGRIYSPPPPIALPVEKNRAATSDAPNNKPKYKHIIVYGLESSGTKFVSASIYEAIKSKKERWDGGTPACVSAMETGTKLYHFSLPFGGYCDGRTTLEKMPKERACELFLTSFSRRWITNITFQMQLSPNTAAVVVLRDFSISLRSKVAGRHCSNVTTSAREHELSRAVVKEAIERLGNRVHVVNYEELQYSPSHVFKRLWHFLGINTTYVPLFKDRNAKHVKPIVLPKAPSRLEQVVKGRSVHT